MTNGFRHRQLHLVTFVFYSVFPQTNFDHAPTNPQIPAPCFMQTLHTLNVGIHVLFGIIGLLIGLVALAYQNQTRRHIRYGRYFLYVYIVVVGTALIGAFFFRASPFLVILTLLGGYVGYSGYRAVRLREKPSSGVDMLIAVGVLVAGGLYLISMQLAGGNWSPAVVYPTLSALVLVAGYDLLKYFWLHQRLKTWWLYEHIYKMLSAYSALLSAFSGTVLSQYKPFSQILPSVICVGAIVYFIWRQARKRIGTSVKVIERISQNY